MARCSATAPAATRWCRSCARCRRATAGCRATCWPRSPPALGLTPAHVEGVASFYRFFHLQPVGRYRLPVQRQRHRPHAGQPRADGRPVRACSASRRAHARADGLVSVDLCSCTGLCDQGPALLVNHHQVVTRLDDARVAELADLVERRCRSTEWPAEWLRVDDNIRRADVLLAAADAAARRVRAALARGAQGTLDEVAGVAACAAAAAPVSAPAASGGCAGARRCRRRQRASSSATPTKASPAPSRTGCCCRAMPTTVFEGMTVAALALGARQGLRLPARRVPLSCSKPLQAVLQQRRAAGPAGRRHPRHRPASTSTSRSTSAPAPMSAARRSALIESLEGKRGTPRIRPPFPVEHGYLGQPTIGQQRRDLLRRGAHRCSTAAPGGPRIGTPQSTGTKIHSVSGDCERPGVCTSTRSAHASAGSWRTAAPRDTQAVQVGGPSGVCLSALRVRPPHRASRTCPPPAPSWSSTARATCSRWRATSRTSLPTRAAASARRAGSAPNWWCGAWTSWPRAAARATTSTCCSNSTSCCTAPPTAAWARRLQPAARHHCCVPPGLRAAPAVAALRARLRPRRRAVDRRAA